jgi:hypothetical protein
MQRLWKKELGEWWEGGNVNTTKGALGLTESRNGGKQGRRDGGRGGGRPTL